MRRILSLLNITMDNLDSRGYLLFCKGHRASTVLYSVSNQTMTKKKLHIRLIASFTMIEIYPRKNVDHFIKFGDPV